MYYFVFIKGNPSQLHWRLSGSAINLLMLILPAKELKLYILESIGFVKL